MGNAPRHSDLGRHGHLHILSAGTPPQKTSPLAAAGQSPVMMATVGPFFFSSGGVRWRWRVLALGVGGAHGCWKAVVVSAYEGGRRGGTTRKVALR